jgi:two-component system cell cycle sensor histidine kinase PleC
MSGRWLDAGAVARPRGAAGSGLGLPLCRALIELHDGCMELESEVGKGTRVTMSLPPERVVT